MSQSIFVATVLAGVVTATIPLAAHAQSGLGFSGTATLGFSRTTLGGIPGLDATISGRSLDLATDIVFDGGLSIGLDFGLAESSLRIGGIGSVLEFDLINLSIEPSYQLGNGAYVGVYYRLGDFDLSPSLVPITIGVDTISYGLFAGFEKGAVWVEGFVGRSNTDPSLPGIRINDYGIAASYTVSPQLNVFGSAVRTDVNGLGGSVDLTAVSIGAEYDFGNSFAAYGSLGRLGIGLGGLDIDATGYTLGGSYTFVAAGTQMIFNAEYSRTSLNLDPLIPVSPNLGRFAVGITIPLGGGASTPLNSNTSTARGHYRSAIEALVNSL